MSLTTDIATLVSRADTLINTFEGKKAEIDTAVAAAIAAVPALAKTVFVDQVNGNDANSGALADTPVKTFDRAFDLAGSGRTLEIQLMSDYAFAQPRTFLPVNTHVRLISYGSVAGSVKRKLILGVHQRYDNLISGDWEVGGFYCPLYGVSTLNLVSLEIVFPAAPGTGSVVNDSYNAVLGGNLNEGPPLVGVELDYCTLTRPSGSVGVLFGARTRFAGLFVKSTTYVTADMAGKWVAGVAANSTPASVGWVASNLSTL
ncbi:hypothetical protein I6F11_17350 [Ensifer sp. NBAIM29]|nr:hypothetical protein [Ensifer sp. NBAIM29]